MGLCGSCLLIRNNPIGHIDGISLVGKFHISTLLEVNVGLNSMINERSDSLKRNYLPPIDRYKFAVAHAKGLVADAASGMGYGVKMLGDAGFKVIGFDISKEAIHYSRENYPGTYVLANIENQTFEGFDTLVCLETLEHLLDPYVFIKNLNVPNLIISTTTTETKGYEDEWHKVTLTVEELKNMLTPKFKIVDEFHQTDGGDEYHIVYAIINN